MDIWQKLEKDLRLLKLNETHMSREELEEHSQTLKKLKNRIITYASEILRHFLVSGVMIPKYEPPAVIDSICLKIKTIIDDEKSKGTIKYLYDILFQTYSLDEFLDAACDLKERIMYQVYAPYWVSKCEKRKVPESGWNIKGETWYNGVIDMFWNEELGIWVSVAEVSWNTCLPPTMEMCQKRYCTGKIMSQKGAK